MADNVTVSNSPSSINTDIPVRTLEKAGEQVQVVAIDYGGAGAESLATPDFATETTLAGVTPAITSLSGVIATEATLLNINSALSGGLHASINSDVLGVAVTGQRNNEIEVSFFTSFNSDVVTNTTASGGSASITGGHARYRTGTNATGAAKGVSVYACKYRPAHEQYAFFTAAFDSGTANSHQRIGLFDTNNGFYIGFEGTSFGVTLRSGASNTFIARASWNGDPLDGSTGSLFTRGGTPEAIDTSYSNLYRIRFAWLGSASIIFEVFSADGAWITFHTIRIPNSQLSPSIQNPELPMTVDIAKTAGAADLSLYTACWAAGTTSDSSAITASLNAYSLAKLTRSVITGETTAGGGGFVNVKVNPSGSINVALGDITDIVGQETMANSIPVAIASNQSAIPITDNSGSITVDGTVAATQSGTWDIRNVSGTVSLPTGAATETTLAALNAKVTACNTGAVTISGALPAGNNNIGDVDVVTLPTITLGAQTNPFTSAIPVSDDGGSITVDGTVAATQSGTWNVTNISGTVSLPTGAATSAKQPSLGTAGAASSDVITVQGISSMTPIKVDGSGVTQPISGTVTANAGSGTFAISAASLPLPSGAATAAKQPALGTAGTAASDVITVQGIASMTALKVDGSAITQPVSGTVTANAGSGTFAVSAASLPLPSGAATETTLSSLDGKVTACNTGAVTISAALPAGTNNIGDIDVLTLPNVTLASQANPFSSAIPVSDNGGSITVDGTIAATQSGSWAVSVATYSTSAVTSVTSAATSTSLLASNASRRQATMYNDADKAVYVKLGATASTSSFSYKLLPGQTLELANPVYTGAIDGIWDSSPTGSMRITEIS